MRNIKSKNNYQGGGGRVKNQRSIFKPLISSSLALALGVSIEAQAIDIAANQTITQNISTTTGTTINFNGENGILDGGVETSGGSTTINIADSSSGTINGNVSTPSGNIALATIVFASGNGNKSLRLNGNNNTLAGITLGNGSASTNNTLTLSSGTTVISNETAIDSGNGLNIVFEGLNTYFKNTILNSGTANINFNGSSGYFMNNIETTGGNAVTTINISDGSIGEISAEIITDAGNTTNINFGAGSNSKSLTLSGSSDLTGITFGGDSTNNTLAIKNNAEITNTTNIGANRALIINLNNRRASLTNTLTNSGGNLEVGFNADKTSLTGSISTTDGTTLIKIANSSSSLGGTISGAVTTAGGSTTIDFANGNNAKSLNLQGTDNTITTITSNGSNNTLNLDTTRNGVSVGVTNAIVGDSLTISMGGTTSKNTELTLNNTNGDSTLKALTLTANSSAVGENVLNLGARKTTITDNLSITSGKGMTINLSGDNVELDSDIANANLTNLNFNGSAGTLTGAVNTSAGTTTIKIADGKSGSISGAVTTESGATTTINFANGDEAKSLTLGQDTNTLTGIAFGDGTSTSSSKNTLTLNGSTTIANTTTIGANQGLTFDLVNANINLTNEVSNTGGSTILNYNGDNGTLTGSISTSGGTTALNFIQSANITQGVSTSGGTTTISIGSAKTATITSGVTTSNSGSTQIDFIGESTLAGAVSTTGGTTTFNLGSSNSSTALATISGAITNSATNIFNVNATTTTLKNGASGLAFSAGTNTISFANTNGSTLTWQDSNGETQNISTTGGSTNINFDNNGVISGGVSTNGTTATTTTIKIADGKSGTINGAVSTTTGSGTTNIDFASGSNAKSLTLGAGDNTLTGIGFGSGTSTNNTLALTNGTTTILSAVSVGASQGLAFDLRDNVNLTLTGNLTNAGESEINFNGSNGILTSSISTTAGTTTIKIAEGKSGTISGAISLSGGVNNVTIDNGGALTLQGATNTLTSVSSTTSGTLSLDGASSSAGVTASVANAITGNSTTLDFNGRTGRKAEMTLASGGNALKAITLGNGAVENKLILSTGSTSIQTGMQLVFGQGIAFDLESDSSLTFSGNISNASALGGLTFNIKGGNGKTNTISGDITTGGTTEGEDAITTLNIADSSSGVIAGNISTKSGSATHINFASGNGAKSLTLNGNANTITSINLGSESTPTSTNNTLILSTGSTSIQTDTTIATGQALTFDLKDGVNLANNISNAGTTNLEFNGSDGTLTGTLSTTAGTTTIKIAEGKSGTITGTTSLSNSGVNNVTIGNGGTLTLQGATNQLTEVSSTTSGTLSLDGASNDNGVSASVLNAIQNNTTTLNFNGTTGKKAEMTLASGGNALKAITLGSGATNNKLILSTGSTSVTDEVSIGTNQALTFDLANDTTLTLSNNLSNTGGEALFSVKDSATSIIVGNILNTSGTNNVAIGNNGTLALRGENNQLTSVSSTTDGTLKLDGASSSSGVTASVSSAITGNSTTLNFNGTTGKKAEMTLSASGNELKAITLGANTVENKLILSAGSTSIETDTTIITSQALTFDLKDSVNLTNAISNTGGVTNLEFNSTNGTLTGTLSTTAGTTNIKIAEGKSGTISGAVTTERGTTNIDFASGSNAKSLTLGASGNTITTIVLGSNPSTNNTLALNNGTTTISSAVSVGENQALAFDLTNGTTLTFNNGLTTAENGTTTFDLGSSDAPSTSTTISGTLSNNGTNTFNVNSATTTLQYGASGLSFSSGTNEINFANTNGATLSWKDSSGTTRAITTSGTAQTLINFTNNGTISGGVSTSGGTTTIAISGGKTATISENLSTTGGSTNINFNGDNSTLVSAISTTDGITTINLSDNVVATITGNIITGEASSDNKARAMRVEDAPTPKNPATNIVFNSSKTGETLNRSTLILQGSNNQITTLTMGAGENILALTEKEEEGQEKRETRRKAVIENIDNTAGGKLKLVSQINTTQADTFVINGATPTALPYGDEEVAQEGETTPNYIGHIGLVLEKGTNTDEIGKNGAVLVASVKNDSGIEFEKTSKLIDGFLIKEADFTIDNDENYTKYLLSSVRTQGITTSEQQAIASAFMLDYNLYMANLNSLNRRMGELRENAHSQGVWARVFNGGLSNDFGLGSKSNYTTIQAGYDYAFGFEGANNYLGVALSYALSFATSNSKATDYSMGEVRGLDNIYSNAVEVALYNSYVADSGWYNDTIAKFSYIMSSFDIQASGVSAESRASETNNYALTLSDEVGYAIRMGEMSEWSLTPQVEATFGYFSQSDFKQTLSDGSQYLDSKAESVLTLRARAGSALTYDFRAFTQKSGFNASLYVGAFYEYDYVMGGDISMVVSDGTTETQKSDIGSDGRVVVNVGTNMTIQDNTRLYFDFEKSFMGKINTDYQVNFGVRYSFGESDGYSPILEKADYKAPLKLEGEESKEGDKEAKEGEEAVKDDKEKQEEKKEEVKNTKDKSSKADSKESKTTKDTKAPAKPQPKEKSSK